MSELRILLICPELYPSFRVDLSSLFGVHMPKANVHSDLVAAKQSNVQTFPEWGGGLTRFAKVGKVPGLKHALMFLHVIITILRADIHRYDAVQVRDMPILSLAALIATRLKGMTYFYWCSYPYPEAQLKRARRGRGVVGRLRALPLLMRGLLGRTILYSVVMKRADHVFVQSDKMKSVFGQRNIPYDRMTIVPMGVDYQSFEPEAVTAASDSLLDKRRVLVYLGTLDPIRQIERLLEAFALIRQQQADALLVIVGDSKDPSHNRWLRVQANKLGIADQVVWTGWLPMQEAWRYVKRAELGFSPVPPGEVLDMGSPTKVPEYLALGIPVVANENPDQKMVLEQSNGGVCVPYSPQAFADAALSLLAEPMEQRQQRIENARAYVRNHRDYRVIARSLARTYEELLIDDQQLQTSDT